MSSYFPPLKAVSETSGVRTLLLASVFCFGIVPVASAQSSYSSRPEPLQPRIEAGAKVGTERSMGTMEGWAPIAQDDDSVLYADIRWMADDDENQEGNLGLGYRAIVSDKVAGGDAIVGGHAWIDRRRTDRGSNFYQITAGAEYLKEDWDVKANAYVPLNSEKEYTTANLGSATPYMAGTGLYVDTAGLLVEEAQPGGDIEVGYRIPAFEQNIDAIRVYGGGYAFIGDKSDDTVGGRVRTSVDINPLINVGARFQYDEPRGSQGFLEATLRFPIKAKKRFQQHGLRARLDESPERDIDIVTNAKVTDSGLRKEVINTTSGQVQRVIHVDNTAAGGGNGSVENPFNTLAAAQAAMLDNDVIYVHQGSGSTGMNQGIVIDKDNVQLIGSGTDFVYDTDRFTVRRPGPNGTDGSIIAAKTVAPTITNNQAFVNDGQGTMTSNTGNGVLVTGRDASIAGFNISNTTGTGIYVLADNTDVGNVTIMDVASTNNQQGRGLLGLARNSGTVGDITVSDSQFNNNAVVGAGRGIEVRVHDATSDVGNITLSNVTANQNASRGILLQTVGGTIGDITFDDVTASNNTEHGIIIQATSTGVIGDITLTDVTANVNTLNGVYIYGNNTSHLGDVALTNITANQNGNMGVNRTAVNNATGGNTTLSHVIANLNTQSGIYLYSANAANLSANVRNSTVNQNQQSGIFANNDTTGTYNVSLGDGTASSGNNRIYGNGLSNYATYGDLRLDLNNGSLTAQGNWWGQASGANAGQVVSEGACPTNCGTADTSSPLTTDPGI